MHNVLEADTRVADETSDDNRASLSDILRFAILQRICVSATYNRQRMLLAPHVLFTKHGDLHADAVTVERDGAAPKVTKVGTFKLAGLSDMALTSRLFTRHPDFNPADPKYAEAKLAEIAG